MKPGRINWIPSNLSLTTCSCFHSFSMVCYWSVLVFSSGNVDSTVQAKKSGPRYRLVPALNVANRLTCARRKHCCLHWTRWKKWTRWWKTTWEWLSLSWSKKVKSQTNTRVAFFAKSWISRFATLHWSRLRKALPHRYFWRHVSSFEIPLQFFGPP